MGRPIPRDCVFLIVEDEGSVAEVIEQQLTEIGFIIAPLVVGHVEAAEHALFTPPKGQPKIQFILSDWFLPGGKTGLEFLAEVRKNPQTANIPFLMVTGNDRVDEMLNATQLGCSGYLTKPWKMEDLKIKIKECWDFHN